MRRLLFAGSVRIAGASGGFDAREIEQFETFFGKGSLSADLDPERLKLEGVPRKQACEDLARWVQEHTLPGTKPTFVGHNAPFDWSHVAWAFHVEDMPNPFGYKGMCTKSVAMGALDLHWLDTNKDILSQRLGIEDEDMGQKHRADYDARYQARILVGLLEVIEERARR